MLFPVTTKGCILPQCRLELPQLKVLVFLTLSIYQAPLGYFVFNYSNNYLPAEQGGLDYTSAFMTLEGAFETVEEYIKIQCTVEGS